MILTVVNLHDYIIMVRMIVDSDTDILTSSFIPIILIHISDITEITRDSPDEFDRYSDEEYDYPKRNNLRDPGRRRHSR